MLRSQTGPTPMTIFQISRHLNSGAMPFAEVIKVFELR